MISCLLEGPVRLDPGSVLQHCHLQVRTDSGAEGRQGCRGQVLYVLRVPWAILLTQDAFPLPCQGPIHIGAGCFVSGLDMTQSKALHGLELHDLVLQGHHVRLHGTPGRAFTLVGRLDSWEVGVLPTFLHPHV